ncbi:hypothetical protein FD754_008114, partial [Muntiacus muntjak]
NFLPTMILCEFVKTNTAEKALCNQMDFITYTGVILEPKGMASLSKTDVATITAKLTLMISVHFQGKPFNITVIQAYAPTSNAEEAKVERLYEDLQDLLELTPKKDVLFIIGDWNANVGTVGNSERDGGIPDHLTCLLRNLYADCFQIGKGVHQGCILPAIVVTPIVSATEISRVNLYGFPDQTQERTLKSPLPYLTTPPYNAAILYCIPVETKQKQLQEFESKNQELKELGELSPHWDNLRKNVLTHCDQMLNMYQDILTELSKETGVKSMTSHIQSEMNFITGYQFIYYSPENTAKAKEVLSNINQLQPLIATHADLLLNSASQHSPDSLKNSLKMLSEKTELFVHAFKDQLVRSALLALYTARPGGVLTKPPSPKSGAEESSSQDPALPMRRQDSIPHHSDYDEEEWLAGLVCGFIIKLHTSLYDPGFLEQLHTVGLIVQYEGLLSTYSEEIGMLEDMAVGISDLKKVAFKIIEATSNDVLPVITGRREHYVVEVKVPARMFESLPLQIKEGQLLHVYPVLFNVGINEQQTLAESLTLTQIFFSPLLSGFSDISHFQEQNDLKGLLENLHQNIQAKKRKNVEIMWLAATICRKLNGIRFTCCKSAKDRTSMSVTLEQCSILRDEHQLHKDFFIRALDCMRRISNIVPSAVQYDLIFSFMVILSFFFSLIHILLEEQAFSNFTAFP